MVGVTAAFFTTPLDVIKTRMQLTVNEKGAESSSAAPWHPVLLVSGKGRVTSLHVCRQIWMEHGPAGFMRGLLPRAANVALWGTCMVRIHLVLSTPMQTCRAQVSAYEFLKRASAFPS